LKPSARAAAKAPSITARASSQVSFFNKFLQCEARSL
jgi:hypothetical protein